MKRPSYIRKDGKRVGKGLPKAQKGKVQPYQSKSLDDYNYRKQMYNDSLALHNFSEFQAANELDQKSVLDNIVDIGFGFLPVHRGERDYSKRVFDYAKNLVKNNPRIKIGLPSVTPGVTEEDYKREGSTDVYHDIIKPAALWVGDAVNAFYKKPVQEILPPVPTEVKKDTQTKNKSTKKVSKKPVQSVKYKKEEQEKTREYTDPIEYQKALQAYKDSSSLYNSTNKLINKIKELNLDYTAGNINPNTILPELNEVAQLQATNRKVRKSNPLYDHRGNIIGYSPVSQLSRSSDYIQPIQETTLYTPGQYFPKQPWAVQKYKKPTVKPVFSPFAKQEESPKGNIEKIKEATLEKYLKETPKKDYPADWEKVDWGKYDRDQANPEFEVKQEWVPGLGMQYYSKPKNPQYYDEKLGRTSKKKLGGQLPKAQQGINEPIYVSDKNDPRLKAYQDSSATYNLSRKIEKIFDINPTDPRLEDYNKKAAALSKRTGIKPVTIKGSLGWTQPFRENLGPIEDAYMAKYKKPVQPYIYKEVPIDEQKPNSPNNFVIYTDQNAYNKAHAAELDSINAEKYRKLYRDTYVKLLDAKSQEEADKISNAFNKKAEKIPSTAGFSNILSSIPNATISDPQIKGRQIKWEHNLAGLPKKGKSVSPKVHAIYKDSTQDKLFVIPSENKTKEKYSKDKTKKDLNTGWLQKNYGDYIRFQSNPNFETYIDNSSPWLGSQYYIREKKKTGGAIHYKRKDGSSIHMMKKGGTLPKAQAGTEQQPIELEEVTVTPKPIYPTQFLSPKVREVMANQKPQPQLSRSYKTEEQAKADEARGNYIENPTFMDYVGQAGYMPYAFLHDPFSMGEMLKQARTISSDPNLNAYGRVAKGLDKIVNPTLPQTLINVAIGEGIGGLASGIIKRAIPAPQIMSNLFRNLPKGYPAGIGPDFIPRNPNPKLGEPAGTIDDIRKSYLLNKYDIKTDIEIPYQTQLDADLIRYNNEYGTNFNVRNLGPTDADKLSGYTDIPQFNEQLKQIKATMQFGKRPLLSKKDFFTNDELNTLIKQYKDYYDAKEAFEQLNPEEPGTMIFKALSGDKSSEEAFKNLFPNAKLPNFRSKFIEPNTLNQLRGALKYEPQFNWSDPLNPKTLKSNLQSQLTKENKLTTAAKNYQDMLNRDWHLTDPKGYLEEMKGMESVEGLTDAEISNKAKEVYNELLKYYRKRYIEDTKKPFRAIEALQEIQPNKKGGELSKSKAREILRDGTTHGNPLTDKQKRYFGWIAGGGKPKYQTDGEIPDLNFLSKDFTKWTKTEKELYQYLKHNYVIEPNKDIENYITENRKQYKDILDALSKEQKSFYQKNPNATYNDFEKYAETKGLYSNYDSFMPNLYLDEEAYNKYYGENKSRPFYELDQKYNPQKYLIKKSRDEYKQYLQSEKYKNIAKKFWGDDSDKVIQKQLKDINNAEYKSSKELSHYDKLDFLNGKFLNTLGSYNPVYNSIQMVKGNPNAVIPHEISHLTDRNETPLSVGEAYEFKQLQDDDLVQRFPKQLTDEQKKRLNMSNQFSKWEDLKNDFKIQFDKNASSTYKDDPDNSTYLTKPSEVRARVNAIRNELNRKNINWNNTGDIEKFINTLPDTDDIKMQYRDLDYIDEDLKNKLFNEYAYQKSNSNKSLFTSKYGGSLDKYQEGGNCDNGECSPEGWEKEIRDIEHKIGDPSKWTQANYQELQNKLNEYKDWRENTPKGRAVIDYHNEPNEYVVFPPTHLNKEKYNMKRALELGYEPDETGHWPSVDYESGEYLKSKKHPTAWKEYLYGYIMNPEQALNYDVRVNPEGYFGEDQLQYVPKKAKGGPIVTTEGFKMGPPPQGSYYRIPSDTLYNPTDYTIEAIANTGERKVLKPRTGNTTFTGASYVDEYQMKKGGQLPSYQTDGEYIPFEQLPKDPYKRMEYYKKIGLWDKYAQKSVKPAHELKPENKPQPKSKKLETNQTINKTIKENVTLSPVSTYSGASILNKYGRKQNIIRAEELRKQQELEDAAEPSVYEKFKSAMDRGWGKYVASEEEENIAPVDTTKKMVDIKNIPTKDRSIYGYKETRTVKDPYGPGVVFQNTFDNDKGGLYKIGYKVAELGVNPNAKSSYEGVEAVAHFLRDADVLDNQKLTKSVKTPTGKLNSRIANKYISYSDKEVTPDDYVMLYKKDEKNPENYRVKYKKYKELTTKESKEWQHDLPVKSYRFADIDWQLVEPSKKTGWKAFNKSTKFVPLKSNTPSKKRWSTTYLPYKDSDAFSEYSGASVIYLFKDPVTGKQVGVDASGSINELKKAGEDIIKSYGVKPEDLTLAHHDTGSYSLKPKAQNNKLDYKQWKNFNQYNAGYSGAPLMIVKDWDKMKKGGSAKPKISYIRKDGRTVHK